MRAKIWGCRGSLASPGPGTVAYGGNTSCLSLGLAHDTPVCLHADTGIRAFGSSSRPAAASPLVGRACGRFAQATDADRLVLFHHDPLHTDADLEVLGAQARELWADEEREAELASEGTELAVPLRHASRAWSA